MTELKHFNAINNDIWAKRGFANVKIFEGVYEENLAAHFVKCVTEHEALNRSVIEYAYYISELHDQEKALKQQVAELVKALDAVGKAGTWHEVCRAWDEKAKDVLAKHTTKEGA